MIVGSDIINATVGVRQGSPSPSSLFTTYVDQLVRSLAGGCRPDGFICWLHCLLLMDDTVLPATYIEAACNKLQIPINNLCIKASVCELTNKNKVHYTQWDKERPRETFGNWDQYVYLGSLFPQDGKGTTAVRLHQEAKQSHMYKFIAFLRKNVELPFLEQDEGVPVSNDVSPAYVQLRVMAVPKAF